MRKVMVELVLMGLILIIPAVAAAQETANFNLGQVVVTATRRKEPVGRLASSLTVITGKEIERQQAGTVLEVLRNVPGLDVVRTGGLGGTTSVYLRGSNAGQTLVLLNGVEINDPGTPAGSFNFADLSTDNIERIEIIRGPQSALYGSSAMGGVINIITRKGAGKPKFYASFEGGSYATYRETMGVGGSTKATDYSFSASRIDSEGFPWAPGGRLDNGYGNTTLSGRFGFRLFEKSKLGFILRYNDSKTHQDDWNWLTAREEDDPNSTQKVKNFVFKTQFSQPLNDWWEQHLSVSFMSNDRDYQNPPDALHPTAGNMVSWYDGVRRKVDWRHNFFLGKFNTITAGFEYDEETAETYYRLGSYISKLPEKRIDNRGYYFQDELQFGKRLFVTAGVRTDDRSTFGSDSTYKLSSVYLIKETGTKLKANWGTGFKAPSIYQLYSRYGNLNLKPEESESYDLGIEQRFLSDKISLGATYFHNSFKNLIDYDYSTSKYKNVGRARTEGIETTASLKWRDNLSMALNYTFMDTENEITNKELGRRPKHKGSLIFNYQPTKRVEVNLVFNYVGTRWDDSANTREVADYTTVNLAGSYQLNPNVDLFGRIDNLFDKSYQEVKGYATAGLSLYAGMKVNF